MLDRRQKKGTVIKLSVAFAISKCKIQFMEKIVYHDTLQHCDSYDSVHQKYKSLSISICMKYFCDQVIGSCFNNRSSQFSNVGICCCFLPYIIVNEMCLDLGLLDKTRHLKKKMFLFYRPKD